MDYLEELNEWFQENKKIGSGTDPELENYTDPSFPISNNTIMSIIGATGSGKSHHIKLILEKDPYDVVFIASSTKNIDQTFNTDNKDINFRFEPFKFITPSECIGTVWWYITTRNKLRELTHELNDVLHMKFPDRKAAREISAEMMELCEGHPAEMFDPANRVLVILDDCGYMDGEIHKNGATPLSVLVAIRRHFGIGGLICLHRYNQLSAAIRAQLSDIACSNKVSEKDYKMIYEEMPGLNKFPNLITSKADFHGFNMRLAMGCVKSMLLILNGGMFHSYMREDGTNNMYELTEDIVRQYMEDWYDLVRAGRQRKSISYRGAR